MDDSDIKRISRLSSSINVKVFCLQRTATNLVSETHNKEPSTSKSLQTNKESDVENISYSSDELTSSIKKTNNDIPNHKDYIEVHDHCARSRGSFWLMASCSNDTTIKECFKVDNKATANTNSSCARTRITVLNKTTSHST